MRFGREEGGGLGCEFLQTGERFEKERAEDGAMFDCVMNGLGLILPG